MTIYIVDIEAVDTRYTKQWKEYLPRSDDVVSPTYHFVPNVLNVDLQLTFYH